jgi:hypothetical protein
MCTPQCAAARTSVMPAASASPYASQHSFLRSRAREVPVRALKVLRQAVQR